VRAHRRRQGDRKRRLRRQAERVRELGADEVFVHSEVGPSQAVAELTGGAGVDAVLDTTAGPLLGEHLACLRRDGRLAFCGAHAGEKVEVDMLGVFVRGLRILGSRIATPDEIRTALELALEGAVRVPIDREFHLSEAAAAHEYLERREHVGKVLLTSAATGVGGPIDPQGGLPSVPNA
jgi:NADPH2:quinone reductase